MDTPTIRAADRATDRPLALTRDGLLAEELVRLAAAAGVSLDVVPAPVEALAAWSTAPVVLVGADVVGEIVELGPGRRPGVQVVAWSPPPPGAFRDALLAGAERVVELPVGAEWLAEALTDLGEAGRGEGLVVGVTGGSGGAGATTFACALGQVAAAAGPALVVDLDPLGPGCDRVLALDEAAGVRWDSLGRASGRMSGRSLREAVPRRGGLGVLAAATASVGARPPDPVAVREAVSAARRGHDLVVVDLPRSVDPVVLETAARCSTVVVVVEPTATGLAAAVRRVAGLGPPDRLGLLVRGHGVDPRRVADLVGVPVLASMADQRGLAESLDLGLGPVRSRRGPLARAVLEVWASVVARAPAPGVAA